MKGGEVKIYFEIIPEHYTGDYPSVTIRHKKTDELEAR